MIPLVQTFERDALRAFRFLEEELAFTRMPSRGVMVCYRRDAVMVEIYHDLRTSEVGVLVSLEPASATSERDVDADDEAGIGRSVGPAQFSLDEILAHAGSEATRGQLGSLSVVSATGVAEALEHLATGLARFARPLLEGDAKVFDELASERRVAARAYNEREEERRLRNAANHAWEAKDYARVVQILEPRESLLSPAERKKLGIARTRMRPG